MIQRVTLTPELAFVGGVAINSCIVKLLVETLQVAPLVPDDPQIIGAYGCAIA
jgi:activator of 2-hydroxyglutaryl-CoA dehydratase